MGQRVRLGTNLSLATVWNTVHMLEPLSPQVLRHVGRQSQRAAITAEYMGVGPRLFELSPIEDCDVAVLPFAWEDVAHPFSRQGATWFLKEAAKHGRPVLVFHHLDDPADVPAEGTIVFRRSLHASSRRPTDLAQPAWITDPIALISSLTEPRPHTSIPTVSFCGYAPPLGLRPAERAAWRLRDVYRRTRTRLGWDERRGLSPPTFYRADALRRLARDGRVDTRFIIRPEHSSTPAAGYASREHRSEYFDNLLGSDYALAVRGFGNYSVRFYEALACRRIPLFLDTDCVLPFESELDWSRLVVRVDRSELRKIGDRLVAAHQRMTTEELTERQDRSRRVWQTHLSMAGFFTQLHRRILGALGDGDLVGPDGHRRLARALT